MKGWRFTVIFFLLISLSSVSHSNDKIQKQLNKLNEIIRTAQTQHLNEHETNVLVDAAIRGLLKELDPHSYYFTRDEIREIESRRNGNFFGVGITFTLINDTATILNLMREGPALTSGLDIGDKILRIDGKNTKGMSIDSIDKKLRGERNTYVSFDVMKASGKIIKDINVVRSRIPIYSINSSYIVNGTNIAYIRISRFNATTHIELTDSLNILSDLGMKGLIIDLRGNPGGIVEQVYLVADEFIEDNNDIFITRGRDPAYNETYKSTKSGNYEDLPLVLLIDSTTASAPEILAGAIQDLDRGIIIGQNSYGKGLVQRPYKLADGSELWLTVAQYYTPSGRNIQKNYTHKQNYTILNDRRTLKDGLNFEHTAELLPEYGYSENIPVFRTKSGRPVLASGGIVPDYILREDSTTNLTKNLIDKNLFNMYCLTYFLGNRKHIETIYKNNFRLYYETFHPDTKMLEDFVKTAKDTGVSWNDEEYSYDESFIRLTIKATLAGIIWDENKRNEILTSNSKYIKKAVELLPVAERIIHRN